MSAAGAMNCFKSSAPLRAAEVVSSRSRSLIGLIEELELQLQGTAKGFLANVCAWSPSVRRGGSRWPTRY